jgi:hypothetical protein
MFDSKFVERFNLKWVVDSKSGCWLWTASVAGRGYGQIKLPRQRKQEYAHRVSYVCHTCDNPLCVNPDHLWLGSAADNSQDMKSKNRHLYGELNTEAKLTDDAVRKIKKLLGDGISQSKIAAMFGVGQMAISRIKTGKRWSHIT